MICIGKYIILKTQTTKDIENNLKRDINNIALHKFLQFSIIYIKLKTQTKMRD